MEHITQQTLAFDKLNKVQESQEYISLLEKETKLLQEIEKFKEALASTYSDLAELRKKLRPLKKKAGTYKPISTVIYEYVKDNPGKRFSDVVRHVETTGYLSTNGGCVTQAKDKGIIIEKDDGTYIPGSIDNKNPYGLRINTVMDYARQVDWFGVKECSEYIVSKKLNIDRTSINSIFNHSLYKDRFQVDRSGKFFKYRLKDEYRSL